MKANTSLRKDVLFFFSIFFFLFSFRLTAQNLTGYDYNNYAGINSVISNPASIAASRYKVHFNLLTVGAFGGNNAYKMDSKKFFTFRYDSLTEGKDYQRLVKDDKKNTWFNTDILGPSVLVNLNKKSAIALSTRFRMMFNEYNLSNNTFNLLDNPPPSLYGINVKESNDHLDFAAFADLGITYARVIKDDGKTFLKAGITAKYYKGISAGSLRIDQMNVSIQDEKTIQNLNASGSLMYAESFDRYSNSNSNINIGDELRNSNSTAGLDLGLVYEYRSGKFHPDEDNFKSQFRTIPYDFRLSISVTDLAFSSLRYKAGNESAKYTLTATNVLKDTFDVKDQEDVDGYLQHLQLNNLLSKQSASGDFTMALPTSLHTNIDWHLANKFFINADALISFRGANSTKAGTNYISTISLTPRVETQWFSFYTPLSLNVQHEFNWGAGLRIGPLFVGSGSILSNLLGKNVQNIDAFVGLSVPIYQGKHLRKKKEKHNVLPEAPHAPVIEHKIQDKDKDGIPDAQDACPDIAGLVIFNGCPDTDKDSIPDQLDQCPSIPGTAKYNGCPIPDRDGDGVNDEEDKCPDQAGLIGNHGCPEIKAEIKKTVDSSAHRLLFAFGKATIDPHSFGALDALATILQKDKILLLEIEGHTDNIGNAQSNLKLSNERAEAAKEYLVKKGISSKRISTHGYGATQPIAPNNTKEGRAKNRRIVLKITNY